MSFHNPPSLPSCNKLCLGEVSSQNQEHEFRYPFQFRSFKSNHFLGRESGGCVIAVRGYHPKMRNDPQPVKKDLQPRGKECKDRAVLRERNQLLDHSTRKKQWVMAEGMKIWQHRVSWHQVSPKMATKLNQWVAIFISLRP